MTDTTTLSEQPDSKQQEPVNQQGPQDRQERQERPAQEQPAQQSTQERPERAERPARDSLPAKRPETRPARAEDRPLEPGQEPARDQENRAATEASPDAGPEAATHAEGEALPAKSRSRRGSRRRGSRSKSKAKAEAAEAKSPEAGAPETAMADAEAAPPAEGQGPQAQAEATPASDGAPQAKQPRSRSRQKAKPKPQQKAKPPVVEESPDDEDELEERIVDDLELDDADVDIRKRKRKMFISVLPGEQIELALAEDGKLQEYYVEMVHQAKTRGNIYKAKINNIDAALQAAFVNYGAEKNGFLQIDEVHPEYFQGGFELKKGQKYPPIQKVLKPGQEILVQVVKEPTGSKGAFLTSYLSIPGRYFVLTPGNEQLGISRKIEDEAERKRLKEIVEKLQLGEELGVIVRTASNLQSQTALSHDIQFIKRMWQEVRRKGQIEHAPALIYQEMELAARAVRDYLTQDVTEIWVDDQKTADQVAELCTLVYPRRVKMVKFHGDLDRSMWDRFNLVKQINQVFSREVTLPSGGRIVIDHAEALVAIDINSGKTGGETSFKEMAFRTNSEAAVEIGNQLRLRDIGGQVVIDFIEMKDRKHCREVEKALKTILKTDRARTDVGRMSRFGLLELVRQKLGSSALSVSMECCPCCHGAGVRRNIEWQAQQALKDIYRLLRRETPQGQVTYPAPKELALYLLNSKRDKLLEWEAEREVKINITCLPGS